MPSNQDVGQFWANIEKEIGETVRVFSLGEIKNSFRGLPASTVGMFFVTDSAFYFHVLPKQSWFDSVLKNIRSRKRDEEPLFFAVPFSSILSASLKNKQSFFRRVFASHLSALTITYLEEGDKKAVLNFTLISEAAAKDMVAYLQDRVKSQSC